MTRIAHGGIGSLEQIEHSVNTAHKLIEGNVAISPISALILDRLKDLLMLPSFGYMFPGLQTNPANLLPTSAATLAGLDQLGLASDGLGAAPADAKIPAAYTYLGQFIDHDITLEVKSDTLASIIDPALSPLPLATIQLKLRNGRTSTLDLDSVYHAPAPRDGDKMVVGNVSPVGPAVPGVVGTQHDLPRKPPSADPMTDREALIGDPRNDENLIIAQLHTAFLRAHNAIVAKGHDFIAARRLLRQHYQWLVLHDYLPRIALPSIVTPIIAAHTAPLHPKTFLLMPLEFSAAAFRFGHSMVRGTYNHNVNFTAATLQQLFTFTALSGQMAGVPTLPQNWVIQWKNFVETGPAPANLARPIDTLLEEPLKHLQGVTGTELAPPLLASLAARNLRRGYMLRLPTGQAVARALEMTPLTPKQILAASTPAQQAVLVTHHFHEHTPLWFYVLAEAKQQSPNRLGPVGSSIVARTLVNFVRRSADSILEIPGWAPTLGSVPGKFDLPDLLRLAGVL